VELGALDVEPTPEGVAALLPDDVAPAAVADALRVTPLSISPATSRDDGSVWLLTPGPVRVGSFDLVPPGHGRSDDAIVLSDRPAFGTGRHPTTALCLELLDEALEIAIPSALLDVGTGSGILALAALRRGVPSAVGLDLDEDALHAAAENARLNDLSGRLHLVAGGPASVHGRWPIVLANVQAAPLMEMAPDLARRVAHGGRLVLSGVPAAMAPDVTAAYRHQGMRHHDTRTRLGWSALEFQPSW